MALTVNELADNLGVDPDDIRVLMAQYAGDVPMWDEADVLAPEAPVWPVPCPAPDRP